MKTIHQMAIERIVYFNGKLVPESNALVPFRERGFLYDVGAIVMVRKIRRRIIRLDERLERFYATLRGLHLDAGMPLSKIKSITEQVLELTISLLGKNDDFWIAQRVSGRIRRIEGDNLESYGPTVFVECLHMPIAESAAYFRDGIPAVTPRARRAPPDSIPPCAKSYNYLNMILVDRKIQSLNPGS